MKETVKFIVFLIAVILVAFFAVGKITIYQINEPSEWPPKETVSITVTPTPESE